MSNSLVLTAPDEDANSWGPAMRSLTTMQRAFVLAKTRNPMLSNADTARAAGCTSSTTNGLAVSGHRLAHHPGVLLAMKEEAEKMTHANVTLAAGVLQEILLDPSHKDRYKVAAHVLAMAGLSVVQKTETTHNVNVMADKEKLEEIIVLAKRLGMDPRAVLGGPEVIDAQFTPVEDDPFSFAPGEML